MYNFQIETSFVNLNPLSKQEILDPPLLLPFILFYLQGSAHMGPIWNPVALPICVPYGVPYGVPYRLLAGTGA